MKDTDWTTDLLRGVGAVALGILASLLVAMILGEPLVSGVNGYVLVIGLLWVASVMARLQRPANGDSENEGLSSTEGYVRQYRDSSPTDYCVYGVSSDVRY